MPAENGIGHDDRRDLTQDADGLTGTHGGPTDGVPHHSGGAGRARADAGYGSLRSGTRRRPAALVEPARHRGHTIRKRNAASTARESTLSTGSRVRQAVGRAMGHFYEAARQVTCRRSRFADHRQTSSERARPLNQPGAVRANGFVSLLVKPLTSRGPSHFYARSVWHDTCRRTIRSEGGVAHATGRLSTAATCLIALTPPA